MVLRFGAVTISPQTLLGVWIHDDQRYEDELLKFVVDADDSRETEQFLSEMKHILLQRFEKIEIYIASYAVDIL